MFFKLLRLSERILARVYHILKRYNLRNSVVNAHHDVLDYNKKDVADLRKQGFSFSESIIYDLASRNYKEYISTWEAYQPRLVDKTYFPISDDKYLFYLVFSHFVKTPRVFALIQDGLVTWLNNEYCEDLFSFIQEQKNVVIKDRSGADGFNVLVLKTDDSGVIRYRDTVIDRSSLSNLLSRCQSAIVQECIVQGAFENAIYDKSVNTIRIVSVRKPGELGHEIVAALQRVGTKESQPVDNFNQGGGSCLIDIETGVLGPMMTTFHKGDDNRFIKLDTHPDSGVTLTGLRIPNWSSIKSTIIDLTYKLPFFEYIAWDVVLQDEGIAVIETNMKSSLNVFQIHHPMRYSFMGEKYREHGWLVDSN